jgi:hypothetical protein
MAKVFEDYFTELQSDIISICLEYVCDKADTIYIYCSFKNNAITSNYFFFINNMLVKKNKVPNASMEQQRVVIKTINKDIEEINELCIKYNKPMPTEIKIIYDVARNSMKAEYKYELVYSNISDKSAMMICDEWFDSLQKM